MQRYNPKEIEPKWQQAWADQKLYAAVDFDEHRQKYVLLTEFPYPSGDGLHLGHVREYTLGDIMARHKRMNGYNVLFPMGYDAFGLPTENYAIKNKIAPQVATEQNVANFRKQFISLGYGIDWDRSVNTTDPAYYKWTQWLFLQFYKQGLAYQDEIAINWCPKCKTGLANEEVVNGRHERCGTLVEKKFLKQWLLKITDYADRLIDGLQSVDYPSRIADQQVNWIGRSKGAEIDFKIDGIDSTVRVFTTRPDTIYGATFMVVAPEHELLNLIVTDEQKEQIDNYVLESSRKDDIERMDAGREKTGVFTGGYAVNPLNGDKIQIWTADYVLMGYGTGAIMAVPAHDERDHVFAEKYELPIRRVISNEDSDEEYTHAEGIMINSGPYNDLSSTEAREKIVADMVAKSVGAEKVNYRLRDWIFSRQHYWGEPIPIIHCDKDGAVAVPEDQLPVVLPQIDQYEPTESGESPLSAVDGWVNTACPTCGGPAKRETDTMPNWAGSSWYYLRYFDAHNDSVFADRKKLEYWGGVDLYLGGMEHTTLHLLYSRFWHQFLYDQGLVPTPEPYKARRGQGIILATDGTKMSKSKGNVVNPTDIIDQGYGADSVRLAITFLAPYEQTSPWNPEGVAGTYRFLNRTWTITQEHLSATKTDNTYSPELDTAIHRATKRISKDLHEMGFNTAISALMELVNELYKLKLTIPLGSDQWTKTLVMLTQLVAPFAPHISEELWKQLGQEGSVHISQWPTWDDSLLITDIVTIVVQINGKLRGELVLPTGSNEEDIVTSAKADTKIVIHLEGKEIRKVIYIPDKLVNFVV